MSPTPRAGVVRVIGFSYQESPQGSGVSILVFTEGHMRLGHFATKGRYSNVDEAIGIRGHRCGERSDAGRSRVGDPIVRD